MIISAANATITLIYSSTSPILSTLSSIGQSAIGQTAIALTAAIGLNLFAKKFQSNPKEISEDDTFSLAEQIGFGEEENQQAAAEILEDIEPGERKEFVQLARDFFYSSGIFGYTLFQNSEDLDEEHALILLEIIANTPQESRKTLLTKAASFIYENETTSDEKEIILDKLSNLTEKQIEKTFYYTRKIILESKLDEKYYASVLILMSYLPEKRQQLYFNAANYWVKSYKEPIPPGYLHILTKMFIKFEKERDIISFFRHLELYLNFYRDLIKNGNTAFLETLLEIELEDLDSILKASLDIFGTKSFVFGKIRNDEMQKEILIFISENRQLIPLLLCATQELWHSEQKLDLVRQLASVPKETRLELMEFTWRLMGQHSKGGIPGKFIEKLKGLSREKRAGLVKQAERILPLLEGSPLSPELLNRFIDIGDELPSMINQAIASSMSRKEIFQFFSLIPGEMTLAARNGESSLDVHHGNRDKKTRDAFLLLVNATKEMTADDMNMYVQSFLEILKKDRFDNARFILTEDDHSSAFRSRFLKDFSLIQNTKTSGREIIGRLCYFIAQLDHVDQQNAIESMINVLHNESGSKGSKICPLGITERLFTSVLQGRLKHVQIDEAGDIGLISIRDTNQKDDPVKSINDFFSSPEHRKITNYEELKTAAIKFCQINQHKVNQNKFLNEIEAYASAQGIKTVSDDH